jgi:hypothetical protein
MLKRIAAASGILLGIWGASGTYAVDRAELLGTWKLVSWEVEMQSTGARTAPYGKNPNGYLVFTPEGRLMVVVEGEGRKAPKTVQDRATLLDTMTAYSGIYRLEGDRWITKVDVAYNPALKGTQQERSFKLTGDRLEVLWSWHPDPNLPGSPITRTFLAWVRAKQ